MAFLGVNFTLQKLCQCKKMTIIRYDEITHSSLWWSHHVLLIEIRNVYFAISSLYYQSSPIVGTSSTFSISLGATTFQFFTHFKMICTKFPRPSSYFFLYKFNEYDRANYEICFYIPAGIFGTALKQLYFAAIPLLTTLLYPTYWKVLPSGKSILRFFKY